MRFSWLVALCCCLTFCGLGFAQCRPASGQSLAICTPASGATVSSPVQFVEGASGSIAISAQWVYLDNAVVFKTSSLQISTTVNISPGPHNLRVQAWSTTGTLYKAGVNITVAPGVSITISPTAATIPPGGTKQFGDTVSGSSNTSVSWSVDGVAGGNATTGTISSTGFYTAPGAIGAHTVTVTSAADTTKRASASVNVQTAGSCTNTVISSVRICSPANGASVASPIQFVSQANSKNPISANWVYLDNIVVFKNAKTPSVSALLTVASGSHTVRVKTWDASGALFSAGVNITVQAPPPAPMLTFSASPTTINAGGTSTLHWTTTNANALTIDNGVGSVQPLASGSVNVSPAVTVTYTATATGAGTQSTTEKATVIVSVGPPPTSNANVLTWHMDNARSGLNSNETMLTPTNVKSGAFGKVFSYALDGYPYAQPLYVSGLNIAGGTHNVVFAATENDSVYAFDADNFGDGSPLWKVSLLGNGETPRSGTTIKPWVGITSTPAIDLKSQTMYVVSSQQNAGGTFFRLHALDITTGAERPGSPVIIKASAPGTNSDAVNGIITLKSTCLQRSALLLANGEVYIGIALCHTGWFLAYNASSLAQVAALALNPNADGYDQPGDGNAGVWMGGGGAVGDDNGNVYITTGNGPYDGITSWGNSMLKLGGQLNVVDHFTPFDWALLQCEDLDLAAGGAMLIPGTNQLLGGGKAGKMYLVNTQALGGLQSNDAGAAQTLWFNTNHFSTTCTDPRNGQIYTSAKSGYHIFGTAAYFNGNLYLGVTPGPVQQFAYNNGLLTNGPSTPEQVASSTFGTTPFVSANGNTDGIVWVLDHGTPIQDPRSSTPSAAVLRAYDATNVANKLYDSSQQPGDAPGYGIKFTVPIVANGKVFIGTAHDPLTVSNPRGEIDVYGLKQ